LIGAEMGNVTVSKVDSAACWAIEAGDTVENGGLPGTIGTDPCIWPASILKLTPSTALKPPKLMESSRIERWVNPRTPRSDVVVKKLRPRTGTNPLGPSGPSCRGGGGMMDRHHKAVKGVWLRSAPLRRRCRPARRTRCRPAGPGVRTVPRDRRVPPANREACAPSHVEGAVGGDALGLIKERARYRAGTPRLPLARNSD